MVIKYAEMPFGRKRENVIERSQVVESRKAGKERDAKRDNYEERKERVNDNDDDDDDEEEEGCG